MSKLKIFAWTTFKLYGMMVAPLILLTIICKACQKRTTVREFYFVEFFKE